MRRIVLMLLCLPVFAYAADFVIEIPMKLERLKPEVSEAMISCAVMNEDDDVLGRGLLKVPVSGQYDGKVSVNVNVALGQNPYAAVKYDCMLRLRNNTGREYIVPQSAEEEPDLPTWAQAKPESELVTQVQGEIPPEAAPPKKDAKKK